jgi:two-component system chemotaxis response regulator CheB
VPNIIAIGASAGGVEALCSVIRPLPTDLQAAIFVVVHVSPSTPSKLPQILSYAGALQTSAASDGEAIQPSRIYVAPPDRHMVIEPGRIRLTRAPREHRHRPAIDPLFRSAATAYGSRVVGIVMTGLLDDGSIGLHIIKSNGGIAIVQDPSEAPFPSMPLNALRTTDIDYILPTTAIAGKILDLVTEPWQSPESLRTAESFLDAV